MPSNELITALCQEILRDTHRYEPGIEQFRPAWIGSESPADPGMLRLSRERGRDLLERVAHRAGFTHRHFDPAAAGVRLARLAGLSEGLERTHAALADEHSRRALLNVLKLRVLGPYHAPLAITPQTFRDQQADVDRRLRLRAETFEVSDPWFSPLSLYRVPMPGGGHVMLHSHSVDVVSVYLLHQYGSAGAGNPVCASPGDIVLDAGGCWGDTALYFAHLVGPSGRVFTFEFDPESLAVLRANLALNPELAERIEVVEKALWDVSGDRIGFVQAGRCTAITDEADGDVMQVETITIDDFARQRGLDRLGFVKLDVEGSELNALSGGVESIRRFGPNLAIAAYHHDADLVEIPDRLAGAGYRLYLDTFSPVEDETVLFASLT